MSTEDQFIRVLRDWSQIFMHRSMHEIIQFRKDARLSMVQTSVLFHLYHGSSCGVSDIGEFLGVTNPAASQMIHRLVELDLVERTEDPDDRRAKQLELTPYGHSIVKESIDTRRRWMEQLTNKLSSEEQMQIIQALRLLVNAARDLGPEIAEVGPNMEGRLEDEQIPITN